MQPEARAVWNRYEALFDRGQGIDIVPVPTVAKPARNLLFADIRRCQRDMRRYRERHRPHAVMERDVAGMRFSQGRNLARQCQPAAPSDVDDRCRHRAALDQAGEGSDDGIVIEPLFANNRCTSSEKWYLYQMLASVF